MSNLGNFDRAARAAQRVVVAEAEEAIRSVALEAYSALQVDVKQAGATGSPVASGRYASSIRLAVNQIDTSAAPADKSYRYPSGKGARALPPRTINNSPIRGVSAALRTFKLGDTIFISNSVPYVRRIEVGKHSWQAPDGVFERTFRVIVARFSRLNLRVRRV